MAESDGPRHDLPRLIEALDHHHVEYLIVGGAGAPASIAAALPAQRRRRHKIGGPVRSVNNWAWMRRPEPTGITGGDGR
jgi:hypothetical protein